MIIDIIKVIPIVDKQSSFNSWAHFVANEIWARLLISLGDGKFFHFDSDIHKSRYRKSKSFPPKYPKSNKEHEPKSPPVPPPPQSSPKLSSYSNLFAILQISSIYI